MKWLSELFEAEKTSRLDDIRYARVYSINFPVSKKKPEGEQKSFYSSEEAAIELIKQGKTDTDKVAPVARNIFAAAMACEGREDRPTDRRWSAYKNDADETILWDFVDVKELSPENQRIYKEQHPGAEAVIEEESSGEKKAKKILSNEDYYNCYRKILKELGFVYPDFETQVSFNEKEFVVIPNDMNGVFRVLDFQKNKYPEDEERRKARIYVLAIAKLQSVGKLPKKR